MQYLKLFIFVQTKLLVLDNNTWNHLKQFRKS